jgi:hypothetical protein
MLCYEMQRKALPAEFELFIQYTKKYNRRGDLETEGIMEIGKKKECSILELRNKALPTEFELSSGK